MNETFNKICIELDEFKCFRENSLRWRLTAMVTITYFYFLKHLFLHVPLKTIEIISQNWENLKNWITIKIPGHCLFMQGAISFRLPLQGWPPWFGGTQTRDLVLTPWLHVWLHVLHAPQFSKYPSTEVYNQKHVSNPISHTGSGGRINNIQDFRF